jgi:hypothetical protein
MSIFYTVLTNSVSGTILWNRFLPQYAPFHSLVANFSFLFAFQYFLYTIWSVILWPKLFTPLRNLPSPKVGLSSLDYQTSPDVDRVVRFSWDNSGPY